MLESPCQNLHIQEAWSQELCRYYELSWSLVLLKNKPSVLFVWQWEVTPFISQILHSSIEGNAVLKKGYMFPYNPKKKSQQTLEVNLLPLEKTKTLLQKKGLNNFYCLREEKVHFLSDRETKKKKKLVANLCLKIPPWIFFFFFFFLTGVINWMWKHQLSCVILLLFIQGDNNKSIATIKFDLVMFHLALLRSNKEMK